MYSCKSVHPSGIPDAKTLLLHFVIELEMHSFFTYVMVYLLTMSAFERCCHLPICRTKEPNTKYSLHYDLNNKTTCCLTLTVLPLMTSPLQQTLKFWQLLPLLNYTSRKTSPLEFTLHLLFHAPMFLHPIARLANLSLAEDCFPSRLICVSNDFI